jgi:hypothetical protein
VDVRRFHLRERRHRALRCVVFAYLYNRTNDNADGEHVFHQLVYQGTVELQQCREGVHLDTDRDEQWRDIDLQHRKDRAGEPSLGSSMSRTSLQNVKRQALHAEGYNVTMHSTTFEPRKELRVCDQKRDRMSESSKGAKQA